MTTQTIMTVAQASDALKQARTALHGATGTRQRARDAMMTYILTADAIDQQQLAEHAEAVRAAEQVFQTVNAAKKEAEASLDEAIVADKPFRCGGCHSRFKTRDATLGHLERNTCMWREKLTRRHSKPAPTAIDMVIEGK